MSLLEKIIWYILGYGTMPLIFLAGFVGVALVSLWLLRLTGARPISVKKDSG